MGNSLCRKRAASASDSKNPVDRLFGRLQICPNVLNRSDNIQVEKSSNIYQVPSWPLNDNQPVAPPRSSPPKIPGRPPPITEWTDVPLQSPESPPPLAPKTVSPLQQTAASAPVPPPRKHRRGIKQILDRMTNGEDKNRQPVEEPIIVPKKEIIHICDPTRHPHHYHKTADGARKAHSTVIPPVYNDLEKKDLSKSTRRASIPRNSSLPGEAGLSLSQATAQRLESYMTRCRSFGSLLPQQIMDKIKNTPSSNAGNGQSDVESEDSWGGLDDWDLGVIEHDGMQDGPPVTPSSRLPSKKRTSTDVQFTVGNDKVQPLALSVPKDSRLHEIVDGPVENGVSPKNIVKAAPSIVVNDIGSNGEQKTDIDPELKQAPLARRESIEDVMDWFDNESEMKQNPFINASDKVKMENDCTPPLNYNTQTNPFKTYQEDSGFKSDAFFTSKFLEYEKMANVTSDLMNPSSTTEAKILNNQDDLKVIIDLDMSKESGISTNLDTNTPKQSPQKDIFTSTNESTANDIETNDVPKSTDDMDEKIGHSNLLKFFNSNVNDKKDSDVKEDFKRTDRNEAKVDISGFHST